MKICLEKKRERGEREREIDREKARNGRSQGIGKGRERRRETDKKTGLLWPSVPAGLSSLSAQVQNVIDRLSKRGASGRD
jgi:hypothetical protein